MNRRRALVTLIITVTIAWGSMTALLLAGQEPILGLDLQGGFSVVLVAPEGTDEQTLNTAAKIMRSRIEGLGSVQEPEISVQGSRAILVQLPGVEERNRALQAVGTTGDVSFRPVLGVFPESPYFALPEAEHPPSVNPETGLSEPDVVTEEAYVPGELGLLVYHVGPAFLDGSDIAGGDTQFPCQTPSDYCVVPRFTSDGGAKFRAATGSLAVYTPGDPRRQMAIVVDGVVNSAPAVAQGVLPEEGLDPNAVIITVGGSANQRTEAEDLASILRYGALPTTFERERVESVSASLGSDSLRAGLIAGLGGLILVGIYLLVYYRALGMVALVGLSVFGSLLVTALILDGMLRGTTLTLAGVTGIIVSIGITSDSYIVYFERIKEEHRRGRPLRPAADHAFQGAFRTILTGDAVTFMGAVLLTLLAVGPVKAFAATLGLATVIDVFVAYFFTRPAVALLARSPLGDGGRFSLKGAMGRGAPPSSPDEEDEELVEVGS